MEVFLFKSEKRGTNALGLMPYVNDDFGPSRSHIKRCTIFKANE